MKRLTFVLPLIALMTAALALFEPHWGLAQLATIIPTFTPMPTPTPQPSASPRVFRCSCSTPGQPVIWRGMVPAPNYFFARQAASGQCLASLGSVPTSGLIPTPGSSFFGSLPTPASPLFNPCSACACN